MNRRAGTHNRAPLLAARPDYNTPRDRSGYKSSVNSCDAQDGMRIGWQRVGRACQGGSLGTSLPWAAYLVGCPQSPPDVQHCRNCLFASPSLSMAPRAGVGCVPHRSPRRPRGQRPRRSQHRHGSIRTTSARAGQRHCHGAGTRRLRSRHAG